MCYTGFDRQVRDAGFLFAETYTPSQPNMVADRTPAISDSPCVGLAVSVGLRGNGGSVMVTLTCETCGKEYRRSTSHARGSHYCSWACRGKGQTLSATRRGSESRFWEKVNKTENCWLWMAGTTGEGYGSLRVVGHKTIKAHRYSWELHYGPIPDGLWVCHHCDIPACVRPDHLFLGTAADNCADKLMKGRGRLPRGELTSWAKLTDADVREIRAAYAEGGITQQALARRYGVCSTTIFYAIARRNWAHV